MWDVFDEGRLNEASDQSKKVKEKKRDERLKR